ncbi:MAG: hypothetical protein GY758_00690, partial [Fuerstiella sp.]|nr:hypothetical protein [Fuerstiella sp.]
MTTTSFVARLRRLFSPNKSVKRESVRHLRLMQLEDRRVLNATFAFDGTDQLLLSSFDNVGGGTGSTDLDVSFDSGGGVSELVFTLNDGVWTDLGVSDPGISVVGGTELRVDQTIFEDGGDTLDIQILDNTVGVTDVMLNVTFSSAVTLPDSPTAGSFQLDVDGNVQINASLDTEGSDFTVMAGGSINGSGLVTAATVDLNASSGIGNTTGLMLAGSTITADTTTGDVDIDNHLGTAVTLSSLTSGSGSVEFDQSGGGDLITNTVNATSATITNDSGAIDLGNVALTGNLDVMAGGNVTDSGTVDVDGTTNIAATGNNVTLDSAGNDFTGAVSVTAADAKLVDTNAIDLGNVALTGNLGVTAGGNVTQQAGDDITAAGLALMVDGTTTLDNAGNNVTNFAANNGGQTVYRDADTLNVEAITVDGMTITGITTTNDDVKLIVDANDLDVDADIALGTGNLFLDVTGNVTQQAGDDITAAGLALMVDGTTTLNSANDVDTLAADNGGETLFTDADGAAVGSVTVDGMTVTGITTSADDVKLTMTTGNLSI